MSEPIGSNEQFMRAATLITTNPLAITDYQLKVLRSTHPHFADEAEREQAEARSKLAIEEGRRTQQAAEARARQEQALPPVARASRKASTRGGHVMPRAWHPSGWCVPSMTRSRHS
jgi:hypothetical protein